MLRVSFFWESVRIYFKRGLDILPGCSHNLIISIHAPAWGATPPLDLAHQHHAFQSTRPRGARPCGRPRGASRGNFNPRARVGRDNGSRSMLGSTSHFNPRARVGRDVAAPGLRALSRFQSTRPRGARQMPILSYASPKIFQSTRPRGARLPHAHDLHQFLALSIHAPAWGATHQSARTLHIRSLSIHAPAWGTTSCLWRPTS